MKKVSLLPESDVHIVEDNIDIAGALCDPVGCRNFCREGARDGNGKEIIYNNPLFYLLQFLFDSQFLCYCLASPPVEPAQIWSLTVAYLLYCNPGGEHWGPICSVLRALCISGKEKLCPYAYDGRSTPVAFFHPPG